MKSYKIKSDVWLYPGDTPWHFVNVDKATSKEIKERHGGHRRGFGSIRVRATILRCGSGQVLRRGRGRVGKASWNTSIFPDKKSGTYLLPLKAEVREKEEFGAGDTITFTLETLE